MEGGERITSLGTKYLVGGREDGGPRDRVDIQLR